MFTLENKMNWIMILPLKWYAKNPHMWLNNTVTMNTSTDKSLGCLGLVPHAVGDSVEWTLLLLTADRLGIDPDIVV